MEHAHRLSLIENACWFGFGVLTTAFIAAPNMAYWLWVAPRALNGRPGLPPNALIGCLAFLAAFAPFGIGVLAWHLCGRRARRTTITRLAAGLLATGLSALLPLMIGVAVRGPI